MTLGSTIRELREQLDLSREDVAKEAEIEKSYLFKLESDRTKRPSAEILIRVARALHVHHDLLFDAAGYLTDRERAQLLLDATNAKTRLVAQHGRDFTPEEWEDTIDYMTHIRERRKRRALDPDFDHPQSA